MSTERKQPDAAKPWVVHTIRDRGPGEWYRYSITGLNLYTGEEFSWSVRDLDEPRYDLSTAERFV